MKHAINLMPASVLSQRKRRARLRTWLVVDASLLAAGAAALALARPEASGRADRLRDEFEETRVSLAREQEHLATATSDLRQARTRQIIERRIGARPDFSGLLHTLSQTLDSRAFLEQVIIAPVVVEPPQGSPAPAQSPARASAASGTPSPPPSDSPVITPQYQVLLSGVAVNMGVVHELVLRLDQTRYFSDVWPASTSARVVGEVEGVEFRIIATLGQGLLAEAPTTADRREQP